jgi:hypothetical protein
VKITAVCWAASNVCNPRNVLIDSFVRHTGWPGDPYALAQKLKTGFGQYKNKTWNDVADMNPSYIVWCA